jgi:hypothetical protein
MRDLLAYESNHPLAGTLCGYIFESYALEMLEKGGSFECRKLVHGNTRNVPDAMTLEITRSEVREIAQDISRDQTVHQLYVPASRNDTAIDAWIPGIGAFQITVAKKHTLNLNVGNKVALLGDEANKLYIGYSLLPNTTLLNHSLLIRWTSMQ